MHRLVVDGVTGDIGKGGGAIGGRDRWNRFARWRGGRQIAVLCHAMAHRGVIHRLGLLGCRRAVLRSEEHTSELQSLMRISYAVFCLKKKIQTSIRTNYRS